MRLHCHSSQDFNVRLSKESFLVYMAESRAWGFMKNVGRKVGGVFGPPAKGLYYASGGGVLTYSYRAAKAGVGGIRDSFIWTGEKVNEAGHYTRGAVKQVLSGAWTGTAGAAWELAKSYPRDMWMSTYGVAKESAKTYWEIIKSPVYFGQGVREMISGLFSRPFSIGKNLLTLNFKQAASDTLELSPVKMLRQAFALDFKGLGETTRGLVSDVLAPIKRPIVPIYEQAKNVVKTEVNSNVQYYTKGIKGARGKVEEGWGKIKQAGPAGSAAVAEYHIMRDEEAREAAAKEAANEAPKPEKKAAA